MRLVMAHEVDGVKEPLLIVARVVDHALAAAQLREVMKVRPMRLAQEALLPQHNALGNVHRTVALVQAPLAPRALA